MRKIGYAIIDTETLGGANNTYCPCYHLGAIAINRDGERLSEINIIILENLQLTSAFYGQFKMEYYRDLLKKPNVIICYTEDEAKVFFKEWLTANNISWVCAYNSGFDFEKTLVAECIEGLEFIDIQFAFFDTIGQYAKYKKFCRDNGYYTLPRKNCKMTAEICYRFLTNDNDFVEEHTALSDCEIETEILKAVWATHRKFTKNVHKGSCLYKQVRCF